MTCTCSVLLSAQSPARFVTQLCADRLHPVKRQPEHKTFHSFRSSRPYGFCHRIIIITCGLCNYHPGLIIINQASSRSIVGSSWPRVHTPPRRTSARILWRIPPRYLAASALVPTAMPRWTYRRSIPSPGFLPVALPRASIGCTEVSIDALGQLFRYRAHRGPDADSLWRRRMQLIKRADSLASTYPT